MKINREQFLRDLEMVRAGLSPREFIEQSSCFAFGNKTVMTFNDEVACRKPIEVSLTGAVQAQSLLDILGKLEDKELTVEENEKGELEFRGSKKAFGVTRDAEIFLPIDRVETPDKWHPLPEKFLDAVRLVQHCVSTDESKFLLTCIHLHPEYIEACDNHQLMRCNLKSGLKNPVLVRGASMSQILLLGMSEVARTKSWIHFRNESGLIFSCRVYTEDFPSFDGALKVEGHPIVIPKGLAEAADRASVFASDKAGDPLVSVTLKTGALRITGEGLSGWYKEIKSVTYKGPQLDFLIAPDLLKHISEEYSDAIINPEKLKVSGGHWSYITVLGPPTADAANNGEPADEEAPKKKRKREED